VDAGDHAVEIGDRRNQRRPGLPLLVGIGIFVMTGGNVIYGTLVGVSTIKAVWVKPKAFGLSL
jgi:hypothetical protein